MNESKAEILGKLRAEYAQWEEVLVALSEAQITTPRAATALSIKDEIAHLWAWQQISRAHVRAALQEQMPDYPAWPTAIKPGSEGDLAYINAWIQTTYGDHSWSRISADWRAGFQEFLAMVEAMPDEWLLTAGKYAWLGGYRVLDVLVSSFEHHQEHRAALLAWLGEASTS